MQLKSVSNFLINYDNVIKDNNVSICKKASNGLKVINQHILHNIYKGYKTIKKEEIMGKISKIKTFMGLDDYDEDEDFGLEEAFPYAPENTYAQEPYQKNSRNKVVNVHSNRNIKVAVHQPSSYEEAPAITDDLLQRKIVAVNFEKLEGDMKRQVFDFINGSVYAMEGKIKKVTKDVFIIGPNNVEIEGIKEELASKGMFPW